MMINMMNTKTKFPQLLKNDDLVINKTEEE